MTDTTRTTHSAYFETDYGMADAHIVAKSRKEALAILKKEFPQDVGADGFWQEEDGTETPINW